MHVRNHSEKSVRLGIMAVAATLGFAGCLEPMEGTPSHEAKSSMLEDDTLDLNPCDNPDALTILDAYTFVHRGGAPTSEFMELELPVDGLLCLTIENGPGGAARASAGHIDLGDKRLVGASELNQSVGKISKRISSRAAEVTLTSKLASIPRSAVTVSISLIPETSLEAMFFEVSDEVSVTREPDTVYGPPRKFGRFQDYEDPTLGFDFIEGLIMFEPENEADLNDVLARWSGKIVEVLEEDSTIDDPAVYLIEIDPRKVDISRATELQLLADADAIGIGQFSSDAAFSTYVAGLTLYVEGKSVTLEIASDGHERGPIPQLNGVDIGLRGESPNLNWGNILWFSSHQYTPNPFDWPEYGSLYGTTGPFRVTQAWRLLAQAGRADNSVRVSVLDQGFESSTDLEHMVDRDDSFGDKNLSTCTGGSPCPWHGTHVATVIGATFGNDWGVAGTGAPAISRIDAEFVRKYRRMKLRRALRSSRRRGSRVINLSFGGYRPRAGRWTVGMFERTLNRHNLLTIVSAGNDGIDVDATEKRGINGRRTVEKIYVWPCEARGVLCVGGTGKSLSEPLHRHRLSNFGLEDVELFAPYCTLSSGPPSHVPVVVADRVHMACGTSYSAPYVAGVAALVAAANPSLKSDDIRDILIDTAQSSPDPDVTGIVDAYAAVRAALENVPPTLTITEPIDGSVVTPSPRGDVNLRAIVTDPDDAIFKDIEILWLSSRDGAIGNKRNIAASLSPGAHTITAYAVDSAGNIDVDQITVDVLGPPPAVEIVESPIMVGIGMENPHKALAFENGSMSPELADTIEWTSDIDGYLGTGAEVSLILLTEGEHVITASLVDSTGQAASTSVMVSAYDASNPACFSDHECGDSHICDPLLCHPVVGQCYMDILKYTVTAYEWRLHSSEIVQTETIQLGCDETFLFESEFVEVSGCQVFRNFFLGESGGVTAIIDSGTPSDPDYGFGELVRSGCSEVSVLTEGDIESGVTCCIE